MNFKIDGNPDYGHLRVQISPGEAFIAESGAMAWMDSGIDVRARMLGGFLPALIRKVTGGESLFVGEYSSERGGGVTFSPSRPGMVVQRTMTGGTITLTAGSFMACTPGIELKTKFGGLRSLFSGEGLFFIECGGSGDLFFNSFGGIVEKDVDGSFVVDTSHVVAWDPGLTYRIRRMGGMKSPLLSGEGLVMEFSGRGKLYVQTRTLGGVASWLTPFVTQPLDVVGSLLDPFLG